LEAPQGEGVNRAYRIALLARRYALIARRPEFQTPNQPDRLQHALAAEPPGPLPLLDAAQAVGSTELDRLCGYAVALLRRPGRTSEILDLLGVLDPDRIAAIYFALPAERRNVITRDAACAFHVYHAPRDETEAALSDVEALVATTDTTETERKASAVWAQLV
jgi:hypothetical protein